MYYWMASETIMHYWPTFEEYLSAFMKFEYTRLQLYTVVQVGGGVDPATDVSQFG